MSRFTFRKTAAESGNRRADRLREPTASPAPVTAATVPPLHVQITSQATKTLLAIYANIQALTPPAIATPAPTRAQITSQVTRAAIQ